MKITFFAFLMILFAGSECSNSTQQEIVSISYETFTRGSITLYTVTPDEIKLKSTGLNSNENSAKLTPDEWKKVLSELEGVDVSKINRLKAPSKSRASDAALHAILSIRKNDTLYKTNSFDHGNAPTAIKPLVEAILRLAENVE